MKQDLAAEAARSCAPAGTVPPGDSRSRLHALLARIGPGVITGAADDDPSGIATYSQIDAQFGYALGWTILFSTPFMVAVQEISAWIGRATGPRPALEWRPWPP